jgi:hypothetical protein
MTLKEHESLHANDRNKDLIDGKPFEQWLVDLF